MSFKIDEAGMFQSTPSYEGEPERTAVKSGVYRFNPRPRMRANSHNMTTDDINYAFQSTPSYEGERNSLCVLVETI